MKNVLIVLLVTFATMAFGQSGTIRGKVIEAATGWEVIGATVQVEGVGTGTVTDMDGTFSLKSEPGVHVILISYVGFAAQKISEVQVQAGQVTVIGDISMEEEAVTTETVVISARKIQTSESAMQTLQRKSIKTLYTTRKEKLHRIIHQDLIPQDTTASTTHHRMKLAIQCFRLHIGTRFFRKPTRYQLDPQYITKITSRCWKDSTPTIRDKKTL